MKFQTNASYIVKNYGLFKADDHTTITIHPHTHVFKTMDFQYNGSVVEQFFQPLMVAIKDIANMKPGERIPVKGTLSDKTVIQGPTWKRVELVLNEDGVNILVKLWNEDMMLVDNVSPGVQLSCFCTLVTIFQHRIELTST